jgi:hypothetical protein
MLVFCARLDDATEQAKYAMPAADWLCSCASFNLDVIISPIFGLLLQDKWHFTAPSHSSRSKYHQQSCTTILALHC